MESTTTTLRPPRQRRPRPKPARHVHLVEAPYADGRPGTLSITTGKETTFYELTPIPEAAWGLGFVLTKEDRTSYALNLGDANNPPSCECMGHLRWNGTPNSGGRECKHLGALRVLVGSGLL